MLRIPSLFLFLLALPSLLLVLPSNAAGNYQSTVTFGGTASSGFNLELETRTNPGDTPLFTTDPCPVSSGDSFTVVRDCVAGRWRSGGCVCYKRCDREFTVLEGVLFTVWARADAGSWQQLGTSPLTINGITLTATPTTVIPTLTEWGLVVLFLAVGSLGVWVLRRRRVFA